MNELEELIGHFQHSYFRNEENFYTVAKFINQSSEDSIIVTGFFGSYDTDRCYVLKGNYVNHPKYGFQFKTESYEIQALVDPSSLAHYLSGSQFPFVGKKTAERVIETLGNDCLLKIKENPSCLDEVVGLSSKQKESLIQGILEEESGFEKLIPFLSVQGIGHRHLIAIYHEYQEEAYQKILENPYRLVEEVHGIGFLTADKLGKKLGIEREDPRRIRAYLYTLLQQISMSSGDSFVYERELAHRFLQKSQLEESVYLEILQKLCFDETIIQEEDRLYPKAQWMAEEGIVHHLSQFPLEELEAYDLSRLEEEIDELQAQCHIQYDERQIEAIHHFFREDFVILTGGPGTGKTTLINAFVSLFRKIYPDLEIACLAPTGRAAKRLGELAHTKSQTLHSMLKWNLETNQFGMNEENPLDVDVLIVDETSMVDPNLFYRLMLASARVKKICLVGDEDQLPSVAPGSLLRDLIQAYPHSYQKLTHIYRQKEGSEVIELARQIRQEEVNLESFHKDVQFYECGIGEYSQAIQQQIEQALDKGLMMEDIQVLSPMYQGSAGIDVLNASLQAVFNPASSAKPEVSFGSKVFRLGDKVLQLKNQPDDDIYNGDIGMIRAVDPKAQDCLEVEFGNQVVYYSLDNLDKLALAYCISIHKSQGSEYSFVIVAISGQHRIMLRKRLLYTAITRSSKDLCLLGSKVDFLQGIKRLDQKERKTTLVERFSFQRENVW